MDIRQIWAQGTRGKAKEYVFVAKRNKDGLFVLNKKVKKTARTQTNKAENKVCVDTLDEAWRLLQTDQYAINLVCENGTRALRSKDSVQVETVSS